MLYVKVEVMSDFYEKLNVLRVLEVAFWLMMY